jgi:fused signal recognition particle receptor
MSRTWAELLGDGDEGAREAAERSGFFGRLRDSLGKSRRALQAELSGSFDASREEEWERLEVALIRADVGVPATAELVRRLEARGELADLGEALAEEVEELFGEPPTLTRAAEPPTVVLVVGVNGTGKTTTIG